MPFTQQGNFTFLHSNQPDNLSSIMSASQIKASFDSQANELKTTLNKLIVDLGSVTANNSGAENIGIEPISGVTGANVQDGMQSLKTLIDGKVGTTGGTVSGALTVTGILQSSNSLRADVTTAGQTTLVLKNSTDDSYLRVFTTAGNNYLSSSNYGSTASKNLLITGYSGNNMAKLTAMADNLTVSGSGGGASLTVTQTVNLSQLLFVADSPENVITSQQSDGVNPRNLRISGVGGNNIPTVTIKADNTIHTGAMQSGQLVVTDTAPTLNVISTTNDGKVRVNFTGASNWIQSGVNSTSAAKNLTISGMNASTMANVDILATQVKISGQVVATGIQSGMVTITPVANTPTSAHVTFSPAYSTAPIVLCTAVSGVPGTQVTGFAVSNITTTGCDIYVTRTNTNSTSVNWLSIGS